MAAGGTKAIGSAAWVAAEKENVTRLLEQEMEEVEFPVRHEIDWLNEHMAEIFSNNEFNMTEIFKTPGKMRGKTPRTARKRNPEESRVPLSDIFSTANQRSKSPTKSANSPEKPPVSRLLNVKATDSLPYESPHKPVPKSAKNPPEEPNEAVFEKPVSYPDLIASETKGKQPIRDPQPNKALNSFSTYNTDSGYHGLGDDDDELVLPSTQPLADTQASADTHGHTVAPMQPQPQPLGIDTVHNVIGRKSLSVDRRTTEGSFHSAQENFVLRGHTVEPMDTSEDEQDKGDQDTPRPLTTAAQAPSISPEKHTDDQERTLLGNDELDKDDDVVTDENFDDIGSPSDKSTPARPLTRKKSSLSFASLPPRVPLTKKKSIGPGISRTSHVDITKPATMGRQSYFTGQMEGSKSVIANPNTEREGSQEDTLDWDPKGKQLQQSDNDVPYDTSVLHNKIKTQSLHEKISMLGAPRPTKSTAPLPQANLTQVNYPELTSVKNQTVDTESVLISSKTSQEDWIKPLSSPHKPAMTKSQTADIMELVAGKETVGNLERGKISRTETFPELYNRTTPKRSVFSTFNHNKSASAATPPSPQRLESPVIQASNTGIESTTPLTSPKRFDGTLSGPKSRFQSIMNSAKSLFTNSAGLSAAAKLEILSSPSASRSQRNAQHVGASPERFSPSPERPQARNRSATETKGKLTNRPVHLEDPFESEQPTRQTKAVEPNAKPERSQKTESQVHDMHEAIDTSSYSQANAKKTQRALPQVRKDLGVEADPEPKFPLPPTSSSYNRSQSRPRPIKPMKEVAQKQKPQPVAIRVASTLPRMYSQEPPSGPTPISAKQPNLPKKVSNTTLHTTVSNTSLKSSVSGQSQRRAQTAATVDNKKQEERDALLRKEEQKKRTAHQKQQQEDTRRQERERSVVDDTKKASQLQAMEQRKLENARARQGSQPPRAVNDMGSILQSGETISRTDMGPARPPSRLGSSMQTLGRSMNQPPTNTAKPAKRHLEDESQHRPPTSASQAKSQPTEAKRRKTEDEYNQQMYSQPSSLRQQPIRKENGKPSLLTHAYPPAPPPAAHHQTNISLYKTGSVQSGLAGQPLKHVEPKDMAKYTSGKIPFASSNATHASTAHKTPSHKTPNPGPSAQRVPAKASPQYPPSESIHLPEPPTDSEDEDSDADIIPVAGWAQGTALTAALSTQEGVQPDHIFGPVPIFNLEEAFKQDKKVKKFRERTSSANWSGPDGLTQEEIVRDMAARRVMQANGGWSYNVS